MVIILSVNCMFCSVTGGGGGRGGGGGGGGLSCGAIAGIVIAVVVLVCLIISLGLIYHFREEISNRIPCLKGKLCFPK